MFSKVLIANRGAIACRIIRTLRSMGIPSLAVYSEADLQSLHVSQADEAVCIGPGPAVDSYLDQDRLLRLAAEHGVDAIHPGYGFLSENADFAEACESAGIAFIGPAPEHMRQFGLKHTARELAQASGVPLLPGTGLLAGVEQAVAAAEAIGYPLMLKSTAGGGGIGMQLCRDRAALVESFASVERLAHAHFSQGGLFVEKYIEHARHIEVQIFGDGQGHVVALGERDCSLQRRNQKIVEETPAPGIDDAQRQQLLDAAASLGRSVGYRSAGTVEFVYDRDDGEFYFLEVNTRLQVEHGVTEQVTGVDLVEWMLRVAAGENDFLLAYRHQPKGTSIQVRLYAEDPAHRFQPCAGLVSHLELPAGIRVDTWIETGTEVPTFYDPMLAKFIADGDDREQALAHLSRALSATRLYGIETNLEYLEQVIADQTFRRAEHYTRYLDSFEYRPATLDVQAPGTQSIVVSWPGRIGYWDIGVPPSGPMDDLALRLANRLLGNEETAAGIECAVTGPRLRFNTAAVIVLAGAQMNASLDGEPVPTWQPVTVNAGSQLRLGAVTGTGSRCYLAIKGGIDVPEYMGSRTTFTLGQFGGHAGRALQTGDVLHLSPQPGATPVAGLPADACPRYGHHWDISVLYGPHGAPDFFTDHDIEVLFATDYEVHYNSSRTGVRLIGPKPEWARDDGGEAGLHPSNIHDNAYAVGAIDFTGDMPIILGPDGPSLGGFVCPACVVDADLWKLGQLKAGDTVRFRAITAADALALRQARDALVAGLAGAPDPDVDVQQAGVAVQPVLRRMQREDGVPVCYRQAGDCYLLIEYGEQVLDLELRFRVHALMREVEQQSIAGIIEMTPGIRSLQLHYDNRVIEQDSLLQQVIAIESALPDVDDMVVPSRIVHLPLSWDDPSTRLAIEKYMHSVRPDAPWCPSNIEFIRRINGLDSIEDVKRLVFDASYLVLGLGDVYLGAPVATPIDPRHRLVTTKYNPARTWTPENAVGIGGAYLCVYGMEGPGGYQFVGRTVQMWNRYRQTTEFCDGKQWLLRFFDQVRFYEVSEAELLSLRETFPLGRNRLEIEHSSLSFHDYRRFHEQNAASIEAVKRRQQQAFEAERERWGQAEQTSIEPVDVQPAAAGAGVEIPPGCVALSSPVNSNVWQVNVVAGDRLAIGDAVVILEAMKMEVTIEADDAGSVEQVLVSRGDAISAGQALAILRLDDGV